MTTWQASWKPPRPIHHNPAIVLDLGKEVSNEEVHATFSKFGRIQNVVRPEEQTFAFVYYEDKYDAEKATGSLDGNQLGGNRIRVRDGKKIFREVVRWRDELHQKHP